MTDGGGEAILHSKYNDDVGNTTDHLHTTKAKLTYVHREATGFPQLLMFSRIALQCKQIAVIGTIRAIMGEEGVQLLIHSLTSNFTESRNGESANFPQSRERGLGRASNIAPS